MTVARTGALPRGDALTDGTVDDNGLVKPAWATECWSESDQTELVCRNVLDITHDVKSFVFEAEGGQVFRFVPGQFVTLRLKVQGKQISRCYTISSPPTRPNTLAITVKRVVGGPASNWLHDHVLPGTRVSALAPLGAFTLSGAPAAKYLFLSAGSGITPVLSMTRTLFDLGSDADILFVHSARTPADIIFRRELEAMAAVMPNIRVVHICEGDYPSERWAGLRGRISTAVLQSLAPDLNERVTFTCGPAPYMGSVRRILEESGYDMRNYHEESFSFETLPTAGHSPQASRNTDETSVETVLEADTESSSVSPDEAVTTYTVEFVKSGRTVRCRTDESVLDAALAAGLRPPSSCSQGMCGTCKTTMLSGEVDMQHNGGIRPREVAQNKILICCSRPLSDLRIDG
ncbi:hybrid-cluster NAD(P)-dependent oxidoreductase [Streptomyces europaeiscabiei]|uniref:2Fe-2S iron-sulfur cluster-binding protein n=1 Tax=Streptomyces europaeiscabiei TaxID=146819 RepID=UPI0030E1B207